MIDKKDYNETLVSAAMDDEELWFSSVSKECLAKYDKDAAYAAFKKRVAEANAQPKATTYRLGWIKYAAAVLLMVVSVGYLSYKGGQNEIQASFGDIVIATPQGSRTQLSLPDGSKVWLNAGSSISYSQGFGYIDRLVNLVGEGYFEVAHNEKLPLSVVSENVRVKVLGTKFNFRDYPTDAEAIISLTEGSIAMSCNKNPDEDQLLKPGQRATVDKRSGKILVEGCEATNSMKWTNGRLLFDGEPLPSIVKTLERSYNVKITIKDKNLMKLRFYGDFIRQDQTLVEVLDALASTGKLSYERNGKNVIILNPK